MSHPFAAQAEAGAEIRVQRWLPGCHVETDETGVGHLEANSDAQDAVAALKTDARGLYRGADGRLHGRGFGRWQHSGSLSQSSPPASDCGGDAPPLDKSRPTLVRSSSAFERLHDVARHVFVPTRATRAVLQTYFNSRVFERSQRCQERSISLSRT